MTSQMMKVLDIESGIPPNDLGRGPPLRATRRVRGEDTYGPCEINVSSVFAVPDQAPAAIARLVLDRLQVYTADGLSDRLDRVRRQGKRSWGC